jgi:lipid II:glycine glycyltransferase (peptidoglycan interpeptide bridge formation enzyme)
MRQFVFKEVGNNETVDLSALFKEVPFTQASFYGEWQRGLGRKVKSFLAYTGDEVVAYFQLIKYPLLSGKSYFYIPYGPVSKYFSEDFLLALKQELRRIAKAENVVFVRLDFVPPIASNVLNKFFTRSRPSTYHSAYFQPRVEWFLNLEKPLEQLLNEMHEKTRYSIRLSEKRGITTEVITENFAEYFPIFYELMSETARRNGFHLHPEQYYRNVFQSLPEIPGSFLSVARYGERILAIDLVIVFGRIANYVFGGSSSEERNRLPAYAGLWRAICQAKKAGCVDYNFGAISAPGDSYKGWDGLTAFKKKFGGRIVTHSDFFDMVVSPIWYWLYNIRKWLKSF